MGPPRALGLFPGRGLGVLLIVVIALLLAELLLIERIVSIELDRNDKEKVSLRVSV